MSPIEFKSGPEQDALMVLWRGLEHLNGAMVELEQAESRRYAQWLGGGGSALNHPDPLPNYFLWYATSVYPFLTLFAKTYVLKSDDQTAIKAEVANQFKQMVVWRHKIGAHLAFVFPRPDDSPTTILNSRLFLVDFEFDQVSGGRFWMGRTILRDAGPDQGECADWCWSLTQQHENVASYLEKHL